MKKISFILCIFGVAILSHSFVKKDNCPILSYHSMGYDMSNLYIYDVLLTDPTGFVVHHDTLGLFSSIIPWNNNLPTLHTDQNIMVWHMLTKNRNNYYGLKYVDTGNYNDFTGIRQNDTSLFIHPPREDYFRILEFCPYPDFAKAGKVGSIWHWDFAIGQIWEIDSLYPIQGVDTFRIDYKISDTLTLNSAFGRLFCFQVVGISNSKYGISYSKFYMNEQYGMVSFEATTKIKSNFFFTLIDRIYNVDSISKIYPELEFQLIHYPFPYKKKDNTWELPFIGKQ